MNIRGNTKLALLTLVGIAAFAAIVSFAGVRYTSRTSFCASCHEMTPIHAGWAKGSHANVHCHECHVDKNFAAHCAAKANGLRQLFIHLTTEVNMGKVTAVVPDHRCTRCHDMADESKLGERIVTAHLKHYEAKLDCTGCHLRSGHSRERFVGFGTDSCKECHSAKPQEFPNPYLKRPPCTRSAEIELAPLQARSRVNAPSLLATDR